MDDDAKTAAGPADDGLLHDRIGSDLLLPLPAKTVRAASASTDPRGIPDRVSAFRAGAAAFPAGAPNAPLSWPLAARQAYADGWWFSRWNAEGQSANV